MPFTIVRDDITHVKADAIVNAANEHLWAGGGVCGAIFSAAGRRRLQDACDKIGYCETGSAVATPGFALPAKYVIHAVGPVWQGGMHGERKLLASCYRSSLELAESLDCESIAFPLISAGIYGYPHREALEVAQETIRRFLDTHEMDVVLVLYDPRVMELADDLRLRVERYIDDVYVGAHAQDRSRLPWEIEQLHSMREQGSFAAEELFASEDASSAAPYDVEDQATCPNCGCAVLESDLFCACCGYDLSRGSIDYASSLPPMAAPAPAMPPLQSAEPTVFGTPRPAPKKSKRENAARPLTSAQPAPTGKRQRLKFPSSLRSMLTHMDAGFSETLLAMIDTRGLKDAEVYKRANLSRQHFSKIRSNPQYKPTKPTVLALAVALELSLDETIMLLERAGFALSHADQRDVIVEFFIREGIYDVFQINDALFAFDQPLLA